MEGRMKGSRSSDFKSLHAWSLLPASLQEQLLPLLPQSTEWGHRKFIALCLEWLQDTEVSYHLIELLSEHYRGSGPFIPELITQVMDAKIESHDTEHVINWFEKIKELVVHLSINDYLSHEIYYRCARIFCLEILHPRNPSNESNLIHSWMEYLEASKYQHKQSREEMYTLVSASIGNQEEAESLQSLVETCHCLVRFQEHKLLEIYLGKLQELPSYQIKGVAILHDYFHGVLASQKLHFREAHDYFYRATRAAFNCQYYNTAVYILTEWARLFYITGDQTKATQLLKNLLYFDGEKISRYYAKIVYLLFYVIRYGEQNNEKIQFLNKLMSDLQSFLTPAELYHLHFYIGNYSSTNQLNFNESIAHFNESNYYLMKNWDTMIHDMHYLERHLTKMEFNQIVWGYETRLRVIMNENSMQVNHYVESLQFAFQELEKLYTSVQELSVTDSLTGLKNRRFLENSIAQMFHMAIRHKKPISFGMIDIDDFKRLNDQFGHLSGDNVLRQLAKIVEESFRKSDIVIRYGGEEILVLMFDASNADAFRVVDELRQTIAKTVFNNLPEEVRITVSIGLATHQFGTRESEEDLNYYIGAADNALYESKKNGKNITTIIESC